jgi:hypothetical protein
MIDLSTAIAATVVFQQWVDMAAFDDLDRGTVRVLDVSGLPGSWVEFSVELPAAALGQSIVLEFIFVSDDFADFDQSGCYIDDAMVTIPGS